MALSLLIIILTSVIRVITLFYAEMHWKKISEIIGFTDTEFKVILFLISVFLAGLVLKYFNSSDIRLSSYDYTVSDSIFLNSGVNEIEKDTSGNTNLKFAEGRNLSLKKSLPEEYSIDINNAGINELTRLPGIGEKTARNIIEFRAAGKFRSPEDLMQVKGISSGKFNKLKKYILIKPN